MEKMNRFQRGSGCFKCGSCGKMTRNTGDNGGCQLCPLCYEKSGLGNALSDAGYTRVAKALCMRETDPWQALEYCATVREVHDLYNALIEKVEAHFAAVNI